MLELVLQLLAHLVICVDVLHRLDHLILVPLGLLVLVRGLGELGFQELDLLNHDRVVLLPGDAVVVKRLFCLLKLALGLLEPCAKLHSVLLMPRRHLINPLFVRPLLLLNHALQPHHLRLERFELRVVLHTLLLPKSAFLLILCGDVRRLLLELEDGLLCGFELGLEGGNGELVLVVHLADNLAALFLPLAEHDVVFALALGQLVDRALLELDLLGEESALLVELGLGFE
jgi:hypothetical protein